MVSAAITWKGVSQPFFYWWKWNQSERSLLPKKYQKVKNDFFEKNKGDKVS